MLGMAGVIPDGKGGAVKIVHDIKPDPDCKCHLVEVEPDKSDNRSDNRMDNWLALKLTCTRCGSLCHLEQVTQADILTWALEAAEALEAIAKVRTWSKRDGVTCAET